MPEILYGSNIRNSYKFGIGEDTPVPRASMEDNLQSHLARLAGWANGCPIALELSDPKNDKYGPLKIGARYVEVNRVYRYITDQSFRINPDLGRQLITSISRLDGEPIGRHEPASVPESHKSKIAPMASIYGYASPRILLLNCSDRQKLILAQSIQASKTPEDLLVNLSAKTGCLVEPELVLEHALAAGVLEEENCRTAYILLAEGLEKKAPDLIKAYLGLSAEERSNLGIAEIPNR